MTEVKVKDMFICDFCRNICGGGCHEQLQNIQNGVWKEGDEGYEKNKDLIGRKNIIHCLGKYCDRPCEYQRGDYTPYKEEDGLKPLMSAIKYLIGKCNELIEENNNLKTN